MTLAEAIDIAESVLERALQGDEIVMVGRLRDAGFAESELRAELESWQRPPDLGDDDVPVVLYEASGTRSVQRIDRRSEGRWR